MIDMRRASLALGSLLLLAVSAACSAAPDPQPTGSTDEAVKRCRLRKCGPVDPPAPVPDTAPIGSVTGAVCPVAGVACVASDVAIPPSLQGLGCTLGVEEQSLHPAYLFACPVGAAIPTSIGLVQPNSTQLEDVSTSTTACDSCAGAPLPGWMIVKDGIVDVPPIGCGGGCPSYN